VSFLLSAQALVDLLAGGSGLDALSDAIEVSQAQLSAVVIAEVRATFNQLDRSLPAAAVLNAHLDLAVRQASAGARIRAFDLGAAERFAELASLQLVDEDGDELSVLTRMMLASAWHSGLTVISPEVPWENTVAVLGIQLITYTR